MSYTPEDNWRNDTSLSSMAVYKKKFALSPVVCQDGTKVWLKHYYTKYEYWGWSHQTVTDEDLDSLHKDTCENITEAEYLVRKLTDGV